MPQPNISTKYFHTFPNISAATKYYNQVAFHKPRQEIADTLGELCIKSFKAYYRTAGRKPDNIFIFRDGVGDS